MKSFGVKLAFGAATVLMGAFAVAQAQKDRQEEGADGSWTAMEPPSLSETPQPIPEADGDSQLAAPSSPGLNKAPDPAIQLVQHTEPTDSGQPEEFVAQAPPAAALAFPVASQDAAAEASPPAEVEIPDWAQPVQMRPPGSEPNPPGSEPQSASAGNATPDAGQDALPTLNMTLPAMEIVSPDERVPGEPKVREPGNATAVPGFSIPESGPVGSVAEAGPQSREATLGLPLGSIPQEAALSGVPNALRGSNDQLRDAGEQVNAAAIPATLSGQPMGDVPSSAFPSEASLGAPAAMTQTEIPQSSFGPGAATSPQGFSGQPAGRGEASANATSDHTLQVPPQTNGLRDPGLGHSDPSALAAPPLPTFGNDAPVSNPDTNSGLGFAIPEGNQTFYPDTPPALAASAEVPAPTGAGTASTPETVPPSTSIPSPPPGQMPEARIASLPGTQGIPSGLGVGDAQPLAAPYSSVDSNASATLGPDAATIASPGDRRLEGVQSPSIVIQKRAPSEVKVGKPASFVIQVQNIGTVDALNVRVHDRVPSGMRLVDASPAPVMQGDQLVWQLGAMAAGDERTVTMKLVPEQEGELGSVARVSFEAAASVRTISTRPELKIVQRAPKQVQIGQQLEIELEVSNPGTGAATGVVLQEDVPPGLEHHKGRKLDNPLGTLAPNEVRRQMLRLRAVAPGIVRNRIRLTSDDGLTAEHIIEVEVIAPQLTVNLSGPSKKYLERQATYQLEIANTGTAAATNIEIAAQLDRGFTFVSTDYEGQYDPTRHAVVWALDSLPAGEKGTVPLTLMPVEEGQRVIRLAANADLDVAASNERSITVEGFAELNFEIRNAGGPIEIGSETVYEIEVRNRGTKSDTDIRVNVLLPPGLELVSAEGDAQTDGRGLIAFQPHAQLAAGTNFAYRFRVRGTAPGTHLVKASVTSGQSPRGVSKEANTVVYSDQ